MHHFTSWLILLALLSHTKEECVYSDANFLCEAMPMEDVIYEIYNQVPLNETAKSIELFDANYPTVQYFLYPAQEKLADDLLQIKIVSCGVEIIEGEAFRAFSVLEELNLSNNKIVDTSFIEFLPSSLKNLSLRSNGIMEVHNVFSNLKGLQYVDFSSCKIKNNFDFTVFKDVIKLEFVNVSNNNMNTSRSASMSKNIHCLDLSNNILVSYKGIPPYCYDVSYTSFKKMYYYDFSYQNNSLFIDKFLHRGNNDIGIKATNTVDKVMKVEINYLDISSANYDFKDLKHLVNVKVLKELTLKNSTIPELKKSIFDLKDLLYDKNNEVKLDLSSCSITDIDNMYFKDYNLGTLNLSNNNIVKLKGYVFQNSWINKLDLSNSNIEEIENSTFYELNCDSLNLSGNKLTYFQIKSGKHSMREINLSSNKLIRIDDKSFSGLRSIRFLDLSSNRLTFLDKHSFGNLENIGFLNLRNNKLVNVEGVYSYTLNINSLSLTYHEDLSSKIFRNVNNYIRYLTIFDMNTYNLEKNYFIGLHNLEEIHFKNSNIRSVDSKSLNGLFSLEQLDAQDLFKHITVLRRHMFKSLKSLTELNFTFLSIQTIEDESFVGLTRLKYLNLTSNKLNRLSTKTFNGLYNLYDLSISNNELTAVPLGIFTNMKNLETLDLSHNLINKLENGVFSSLHSLLTLNLAYNSIETLEANILFSLPNLINLDLAGNLLITLDYKNILVDHSMLSFISISNNRWNCALLYSMLQSFRAANCSMIAENIYVYDDKNVNGITCTDLCDNINFCEPTVTSV